MASSKAEAGKKWEDDGTYCNGFGNRKRERLNFVQGDTEKKPSIVEEANKRVVLRSGDSEAEQKLNACQWRIDVLDEILSSLPLRPLAIAPSLRYACSVLHSYSSRDS